MLDVVKIARVSNKGWEPPNTGGDALSCLWSKTSSRKSCEWIKAAQVSALYLGRYLCVAHPNLVLMVAPPYP